MEDRSSYTRSNDCPINVKHAYHTARRFQRYESSIFTKRLGGFLAIPHRLIGFGWMGVKHVIYSANCQWRSSIWCHNICSNDVKEDSPETSYKFKTLALCCLRDKIIGLEYFTCLFINGCGEGRVVMVGEANRVVSLSRNQIIMAVKIVDFYALSIKFVWFILFIDLQCHVLFVIGRTRTSIILLSSMMPLRIH